MIEAIPWDQAQMIVESVQYGDVILKRQAGMTVAVVPAPILKAEDCREMCQKTPINLLTIT